MGSKLSSLKKNHNNNNNNRNKLSKPKPKPKPIMSSVSGTGEILPLLHAGDGESTVEDDVTTGTSTPLQGEESESVPVVQDEEPIDEDAAPGHDDNNDDNDNGDYSGDESMADEERRVSELAAQLVGAAEDDPSAQLVILTELCDVLAFSSEDSYFHGEALRSAVPVLLLLATQEAFPDQMLLAIRCVTYLYAASPQTFADRGSDLVAAVAGPLQAIEYLDLAEQCLQLLEKISRRLRVECLQAGVVMTVLNYIDFFSSSYQRVGTQIVANICKGLQSSSQVLEAVPVLCNLLFYQDQKLVENVVTCLSRIVKKAGRSSRRLDELCNQGLVQQVVQVIALNSKNFLRKPIYNGLVELLSRLACGSVAASNTLIELNISGTLKNILNTYNKPSHGATDPKYNQIQEVLKLLNVLLPPLPTNGEDNTAASEKERITTRHPEMLRQFGADILPVLVQVVYSGADSDVCYGCLLVMHKIVYFCRSYVHELLKDTDISSFLAKVLAHTDRHLLTLALRLIETVMQENGLADVFLESFLKQGIVHAVDALGTPEKCHNQTIGAKDNARCLCFLYDVKLSSSSEEPETCKLEENSVQTLAKQVLSTHFAKSSQGSEFGLTRVLQKLKKLSAVLSDMVRDDKPEKESDLDHILGKIMEELGVEESVSTFEFVESGLTRSLIGYLSNWKRKSELTLLQKRFEVFARLCLSPTAHHWKDTPLAVLVRKLQSALSSVESFPVVLIGRNMRESYTPIPSEHYTILPCLKVRFVEKKEGGGPGDSISDVVNVEAFTAFGTIEKYLLASSKHNKNRRLRFHLDGEQLDRELTLFQAILQLRMKAENDFTWGSSFWKRVHEVSYKTDMEQSQSDAQGVCCNSYLWNHPKIQSNDAMCLSRLFFGEISYSFEDEIVILLKVLEVVNKSASSLLSCERTHCSIPQTEFVSLKLTEKLEQQMQESSVVCTGSMPAWCGLLTEAFPFLFGFEVRRKYFQLKVYGSSQVEQQRRRQLGSNSDDRRGHTSGMPRKRLKVCRSQILESAAQVMGSQDCGKVVLEVEYPEEVGTGLGPTLEFFTLVSQEFQKVGLGMWRGDQNGVNDDNSGYVVAPLGLFPRPWSALASTSDKTDFSEVVKYFVLLGQVVAKALQDGRVLDLPLSASFYKLILEQELNLHDIQSFDPGLGKTLVEFQALVDRYRASGSDTYFGESSIEDLCLDFTLPGYPDYVLTSVHDHKMVNISNLEEYVSLTTDATVRSGISRQVEAFKSGFNMVLPLRSLQIFTPDELDRLLCGERKAWNHNELLAHVKFDHGYTASSPPVVNLLEIMQEFEGDQQRAFVQFVTGAPRLPPGGLAALNPKLTFVRKHSNGYTDGDLPSVMTCANYLKLPSYSCKEIMRERVLYAITEGQGSFHLS